MPNLRFVSFLILIGVQSLLSQTAFESVRDILPSDSTTSSATLVDTGLAVSLGNYTGEALVVSSFSGEKTNNAEVLIATYQMAYSGSAIDQPHLRSIQKTSSAAGAGSSVSIVNLTSPANITLQHSENNSKSNLTTLTGSTLSAIPLSAGGMTLNHAYTSVLDPDSPTAVTDFSPVVTSSSFSVPAVHDGTSEIFIMASFDVIANQSGLGTWKLQVKDATSGIWVDAGNHARRSIGTSEGIVTLVALADVSASDNYEVRLVHASDGSAVLTTRNVDLAAVSLSIDQDFYLQSYEADAISPTGATMSIPVASDMQVFAASNITSGSVQNDTGVFSLSLDDGATSTLLASSKREVTSNLFGSVVLAGIVSASASNTNILGMSIDTTNIGFEADSNFVAFGLTAVPESKNFALALGLATCLFVVRRRLKA